MRIRDWSSDVCSSALDLAIVALRREDGGAGGEAAGQNKLAGEIEAVNALARQQIARRAPVARIARACDQVRRRQRGAVLPRWNGERLAVGGRARPGSRAERAIVGPAERPKTFGSAAPFRRGQRVAFADLVGAATHPATPPRPQN